MKRRLLMIGSVFVAVALVASACSSGGDSDETESVFVRAAAAVEAGNTGTVYGSQDDRTAYVQIVRATAPGAAVYSDEVLLAAGDETCSDLAGFVRQERDVQFALSVLWRSTLRDLDSTQAALFGAVLTTAAELLCPEYAEFAAEAVYWLGV